MEVIHPYLGKFIIFKQIGTGSFASVYLAQHFKLHYPVAIKIFQKDFMEEYVQNAFKIAKSIRHPFICQCFDIFKNQRDETCVLMEYIEGMTLLDYANIKSSISESEIQILFGQLVIAVEYLHKHNIIHRDLKCENIMVDNYNNIRLIDFGFSCHNVELHSTVCGSPAYLAPEIIQSENYGVSVDIWSLGIILYAIKYRQLPFENSNFTKLFHLITSTDPFFPPDIETSPNLMDLIKKLLTKQPNKRITIDEIKKHPFFTTDSKGSKYHFDEKLLNVFIHEPNDTIIPEKAVLNMMRLSANDELKAIDDIKSNNLNFHSLTYLILYKNYISTQLLPKYTRCFIYPSRLRNQSHCRAAKTTGDLPSLISMETLTHDQPTSTKLERKTTSQVSHESDDATKYNSDSSTSSVIVDVPKFSATIPKRFTGSPLLFNPTLKVRHFSSNSGPFGSAESQMLRFSPVTKKNVLNFQTLTLAARMAPHAGFNHQQNQAGSLPSNDILPQLEFL